MIHHSRSSGSPHRRAIVWLVAGVCAATALGCALRAKISVPAARAHYDEATFAAKTIPSYTIVRSGSAVPRETVVGRTKTYRIREGDTLLDVARFHDLGYNEIVEANPGVDPWIPRPGTTVVLPTEWVLPCCNYEGIVVNIPEMRLYLYQKPAPGSDRVVVRTYPVGLGRDDRRTPRGKYRVRGKTVHPTWNIPESIRQEHIRERGDARRLIRGGAADNPLGKYRFELSRPLYTIHGTDIPWGVGMLVSHGCVRLYPEDIEQLFPLVPIGTRVEFMYQPVKAGTRDGAAYVEVHRDIYRYGRSPAESARFVLDRQKLGSIDQELLRAALGSSLGVPVRVSPAGWNTQGGVPRSGAFKG